MEQLKPCPFCGGKVEMLTIERPISGNGTHVIDCCASMEEGFILEAYKPRHRHGRVATTKRLIDRWDKRHGAGE